MQIDLPDPIAKAYTNAKKAKDAVEEAKARLEAAKAANAQQQAQIDAINSEHETKLQNAIGLRQDFDNLVDGYLAEGGVEPVDPNPPVPVVTRIKKPAA